VKVVAEKVTISGMYAPNHRLPSFTLVLKKKVRSRKINVNVDDIHDSTLLESFSFDETWKELVIAFMQIELTESVTANKYYHRGLQCSVRKPVTSVTLSDFTIALLDSFREKKWNFEDCYVNHEYIARDEKGLSPTDKIQMAIKKTTSS
jgi:hypothetical protein